MKAIEGLARIPSSRHFILTFSVLLTSAVGVYSQSAGGVATPSPTVAPGVAPTPTPNVASTGRASVPTATPNATPSATPAVGPAVGAGNTPVVTPPAPVVNPALAAEAEMFQKRMERARALAAVHQLAAAATELESIRASTKDQMIRNVSSLMLMGIYLEDGNYLRAESMLEESFKERASRSEGSVRTYFALAGQAVIGARAHVARYRTFGINVSSPNIPPEAVADLERLRSLLERVAAQGKELLKQDTRDNDAFALVEDVSGIRTLIARDHEDRVRWQNEYSAARARLATLPTEIASINGPPSVPGGASESITRGVETPNATDSNSSVSNLPATNTSSPSAGTTASALNSSINSPGGNSAKPALLDVGSLLDKVAKKVDPVYPQTARNMGAHGMVRVKLVIDEAGSVANIVWVEGPVPLRQAAQDAVRQWKFRPVIVDGKPARAAGYIDFNFR